FRIAAELYFNDNHTYPPITMNHKYEDFTLQDKYKNGQDGWANKLSFFVKTAEAAVTHTKTQLCINFDNIAQHLVTGKYLATVPVHPYDNDLKGICYKAVNTGTTFSAYASLTAQISTSNGTINKRTGFILGDTSSTGIGNLITSTPSGETVYPIGSNGVASLDIAASSDAIYGVVSGAKSTGEVGITSTSSSTSSPTMYTITVMKEIMGAYNILLYLNTSPGPSFTSGDSFASGSTVKIAAYPNDGSLSTWTGCDNVEDPHQGGVRICVIYNLNSNRTVTVSGPAEL
ncbi:MAG: hypothetical protein WCO09_05205, partial [bacterium]